MLSFCGISRAAIRSASYAIRSPSILAFSSSFSTTTFRFNETISQSATTPAPFKVDVFDEAFLARDTEKPLFSRKTYLLDYYKYLNETNEVLLIVHHNNLNHTEGVKLRREVVAAGAKMHIVKGSMYRLYLRSAHEVDPAAKGMTEKNRDVQHPLLPLFSGPTAIFSIPACEPSVIAALMKVINKHKEKLFLVGAKVETQAMSAAEVMNLKDLPNKKQLQEQLAGLLTVLGGAGLVRTLESPANMLYLTVQQRAKDLDPDAEKEATEEVVSN
ncbi:uncharacterized protein SPAPADRAFT_58794 [Spathaspora passalidarum NRRL Y-27907]|uniref:Ribosomal protein L10 n=1 Tax=Spathaspora passalidarum (strain NRRL Y-27907 / 11-Y1) TaxID=619300 RepID=G3AE32_SPAPN|nr:uncharacterized protein SPAPADRAFT_58794 [Spathaspora passalidarum NRRL Y-27907]EGW35566.1 hypothetical protein SPAPADRAFT_58794 [Spathaspora passalidarum NRRL Y-27907]